MNPINLRIKNITLLVGLGALLFSAWAMAAEVTAHVDRQEVVKGETVTLILQTDDPQQNLSGDWSVLTRDFEILDQRSETKMSVINGRQVAEVRLMLTLEPKLTGDIVIPALSFQGASTRPIRVRVKPAPELAPGETPPVFIEMSLDPENGPYYVHAQLALTVRIFYQQNLTEAAMNPPAPEQASVRLLDEVPFQSTRNGTRYRVLERRYAIFPERSGELQIPPLTLSGRLIERPADRLWQPSVRGRRVTIESEPMVISVLARPAEYTGEHWLPAQRITLSQQISDADQLKVGEPVTRTIILDAVGLEENMLEEPAWPELENIRIYPDQPQGISRDDGQWVLGHKEFRYAVVPETAGELVLPEIRLDWWDTRANEARTAVLPEHRIKVAASNLEQVSNETASSVNGTELLPNMAINPDLQSALTRWRLASLVLGVLWLATLALWLFRSPPAGKRSSGKAKPAGDESELLSGIKQACKVNDGPRVRQLFGRWIRKYGPPKAQGSMLEFAQDIDDDTLREAIFRFDAGEFSTSGKKDWNGVEFWQAFKHWQKSDSSPAREHDAEPDLYAHS